jgi:hypothetical protein
VNTETTLAKVNTLEILIFRKSDDFVADLLKNDLLAATKVRSFEILFNFASYCSPELCSLTSVDIGPKVLRFRDGRTKNLKNFTCWFCRVNPHNHYLASEFVVIRLLIPFPKILASV